MVVYTKGVLRTVYNYILNPAIPSHANRAISLLIFT